MEADHSRWSFLFRTDAGRIDAPTWWRYALLLVGIFILLTLGWILVEPYAEHDLAKEPFFTLPILAANLYRIVYGFASIVLLVCYYNLSAKRWRDIGRPAALAGLAPFLACIVAALHWLQPRTGGEIPPYVPLIGDVVLVAVLLWNVIELGGFSPARRKADEP